MIIVVSSDDAGPSSETSITPVDGTLVCKMGVVKESGRGKLKISAHNITIIIRFGKDLRQNIFIGRVDRLELENIYIAV